MVGYAASPCRAKAIAQAQKFNPGLDRQMVTISNWVSPYQSAYAHIK
jgi:hypothetical protein